MMAEKKSLLLVVLLVAIWARCDCIDIKSEAVKAHLLSPAFSQSRSYKQPEQKKATRSYIVEQWSAHLAVRSEVPEYPTAEEQRKEILDGEERVVFFTQIVNNTLSDDESVLEGKNYILIVKGSEWGGRDDRPIVLGAHYDTVENTTGTDDNGSGMAALLEVSKEIVQNGPAKYSAIFVAIDFEETGLVGSERFMNEILVTRILNHYAISYKDFQGAIILDTIMNYDNARNSQTIPEEEELSMVVGEAIKGIKDNDYRGTFVLGLGVGTNDEFTLLTNLANSWTSSDPGNFVYIQIQNEWFDMYGEYLNKLLICDHANFWMEASIPKGLKAVFITDTADLRGSMKNCYHAACDNVDSITDTKLQFLAQTSTSLATAISRAIETGEGPTSPPKTNAATTTTPATTTAAVITIALLLLA